MELFKLIRVRHWVKNLFVLVPAFFAGVLNNPDLGLQILMGFFAFSFMASCVYIINDSRDVEADRLHPEKRKRPLASGAISLRTAWLVMVSLFIGAVAMAYYCNPLAMYVLLGYFVMNLAYSFRLKHIALLDITIIAIGFVLRIFIGGIIAEVPLSKWLILLTFLLALLLALGKRRSEYKLYEEGIITRKSIEAYNLAFIDAAIVMTSTIAIVCYIMYSISEEVVARLGSDYLYLSSLFVVLGVMRFLQQALVLGNTGSPTRLLWTDRFIQLTLLLWIASYAYLIYQ